MNEFRIKKILAKDGESRYIPQILIIDKILWMKFPAWHNLSKISKRNITAFYMKSDAMDEIEIYKKRLGFKPTYITVD
jgi:hypothetical protein